MLLQGAGSNRTIQVDHKLMYRVPPLQMNAENRLRSIAD